MKDNFLAVRDTKISALIVDDEEHSRENLNGLLQEHCPTIQVVGMASSVEMAADKVEKLKPEVVFLDIRMSGSYGFKLLELVDRTDFEVIFVTAYDKYAIKAIKFSALDYILKPIDPDELTGAISKLKSKIEKDQRMNQLNMLLRNLSKEALYDKIGISSEGKLEFLETRSIIRLQGESNYSRIYLAGGKSILASKTLVEFEELLTDLGFFRVHKTHLVNLYHVRSFHKKKNSYLLLNDDSHIPVSRRRKNALGDKLKPIP
jgi:two-component system LytT family response regulator